MPPLLCPPPTILDQTSVRELAELRKIASALGEMVRLVETNEAHILLTPVFRDVVEQFAFEPWEHHEILQEIYGLFAQWFLRGHASLVQLNLSSLGSSEPHPLPLNSGNGEFVRAWSSEAGRVLELHRRCRLEKFCAGVVCVNAFAGEDLGNYSCASDTQVLPLVGPDELEELDDAYDWALDQRLQRRQVSFNEAKSHCFALGAMEVRPPSGGSHYKVKFRGARSWTLDKNHDPVLPKHLGELCQITGYPLSVIRHTLITGALPEKRLKFHRFLA